MIFVQPARVPTKTALEDDTTSETNSASAFSSFLKLPAAGYRQYSSGSIALEVAPAITGVGPFLLLTLDIICSSIVRLRVSPTLNMGTVLVYAALRIRLFFINRSRGTITYVGSPVHWLQHQLLAETPLSPSTL